MAYIPRKPLELTVPAMCAGKKGSLAAAADASPRRSPAFDAQNNALQNSGAGGPMHTQNAEGGV